MGICCVGNTKELLYLQNSVFIFMLTGTINLYILSSKFTMVIPPPQFFFYYKHLKRS